MKKSIKFLLVLLLLLTLVGCTNPTHTYTEKYVVVIETNNGEDDERIVVEAGSQIIIDKEYEYPGHDFAGWYLDEALTIPLTEDYIPESNVVVYAKWILSKNKVIFYVGDTVFNEQVVEEKNYATDPGAPSKEGYEFLYWSSTKTGDIVFNFNRKITKNTNIYAHFKPIEFSVKYDLDYDVYGTKYDLYVDYFGDFYNFMLENTNANFDKFGIKDLDDFLKFCANWDANGKDSFYGVGDAFSNYYVTIDVGGTLENQPETTFIGYCYKNNKYTEFIPFLMQFFAYWRTDEGYTGGSSDPNNTGNDFFASPWASLVDTCKFFHFTSKNLNDTYPWFNSKRVKEALDNVPTVIGDSLPVKGTIENPVIFVDPVRKGYKFLGWYDENGNKVTEAYKAMSVKAKWEKE